MIGACWISTANTSYSSDRESASLLWDLCCGIQKAGGDDHCVELVTELLGSGHPQNAYIYHVHYTSQTSPTWAALPAVCFREPPEKCLSSFRVWIWNASDFRLFTKLTKQGPSCIRTKHSCSFELWKCSFCSRVELQFLLHLLHYMRYWRRKKLREVVQWWWLLGSVLAFLSSLGYYQVNLNGKVSTQPTILYVERKLCMCNTEHYNSAFQFLVLSGMGWICVFVFPVSPAEVHILGQGTAL